MFPWSDDFTMQMYGGIEIREIMRNINTILVNSGLRSRPEIRSSPGSGWFLIRSDFVVKIISKKSVISIRFWLNLQDGSKPLIRAYSVQCAVYNVLQLVTSLHTYLDFSLRIFLLNL